MTSLPQVISLAAVGQRLLERLGPSLSELLNTVRRVARWRVKPTLQAASTEGGKDSAFQ